MSLSVLEFMCAALPVLTSDLPSVSTAIEPGVTGVTYRREDVTSAAEALRRLVQDEEGRRALGAAAAASCRSQYTLDVMNKAFVERVLPAL
jgi:glycosyltransferase involved in cell wall biosynthesis